MSIDALSDLVAGGTQYVLIGDTNHTLSAPMYGRLAEEVPALAAEGAQHLVLEFPDVLQPALRELAEGSINVEQFYERRAEIYEEIGAHYPNWDGEQTASEQQYRQNLEVLVQAAHEHGLEIHAVDQVPSVFLESNNPHAELFADLLAEEGRLLTEAQRLQFEPNAPQSEIDAHNANFDAFQQRLGGLSDDQLSAYEPYKQAIGQEREEIDAYLAEQIAARVGNDATLVVYGNSHFEEERDIDEFLGAEKTAVVAVDHDGTWQENALYQWDVPEYVLDVPANEYLTPEQIQQNMSDLGVDPQAFADFDAMEADHTELLSAPQTIQAEQMAERAMSGGGRSA